MQKVILKYLNGYPDELINQTLTLAEEGKLGQLLLRKYPVPHEFGNDKALYNYTLELKNKFLPRTVPLNKVVYDSKINIINHALGLHSRSSMVHGGNLKARHEIKIASILKEAPLELLRMIVVHELSHLKVQEHNKAFYNLCTHMESDYHQLEFDLRLYIIQLETSGKIYK